MTIKIEDDGFARWVGWHLCFSGDAGDCLNGVAIVCGGKGLDERIVLNTIYFQIVFILDEPAVFDTINVLYMISSAIWDSDDNPILVCSDAAF